MDLSMDIMDGIMNGVMQSKEWTRISTEDPNIAETTGRLGILIEQVKPLISFQMYDEILTAIGEVEAAYAEVAALYGMRVECLIQQTAAHPEEFSHYMMKVAAERRATA